MRIRAPGLKPYPYTTSVQILNNFKAGCTAQTCHLQACLRQNSGASSKKRCRKALGRDFIVRLLKSGVKPSISGDLWSDNGMGLLGIYAHGITDTWVIEKALIGLVACEYERDTAVNIDRWTKEALESIGMTKAGLLPPA